MDLIVIGAGYVGLTAACCLANSGHRVTCVETAPAKLKLLNQGKSPILEKGINQLLEQGLSSSKLSFVPSLPKPLQADIAMITVGTPSLSTRGANLSCIYHNRNFTQAALC